MRPRRRLSKGVRIYLAQQRWSFNFEEGIKEIEHLMQSGWIIKASGSEEGAMVVHLA